MCWRWHCSRGRQARYLTELSSRRARADLTLMCLAQIRGDGSRLRMGNMQGKRWAHSGFMSRRGLVVTWLWTKDFFILVRRCREVCRTPVLGSVRAFRGRSNLSAVISASSYLCRRTRSLRGPPLALSHVNANPQRGRSTTFFTNLRTALLRRTLSTRGPRSAPPSQRWPLAESLLLTPLSPSSLLSIPLHSSHSSPLPAPLPG